VEAENDSTNPYVGYSFLGIENRWGRSLTVNLWMGAAELKVTLSACAEGAEGADGCDATVAAGDSLCDGLH
jgi:hypothetical protein